MSKSMSADIDLRISTQYDNDVTTGTVEDHLDVEENVDLADGKGANKANGQYHAQSTLNAGNSYTETLDLYGGITDQFGDTLNFDVIKGVYVKNTATTPGHTLSVGDATNDFNSWLGSSGEVVKIGPGGHLNICSPVDGYPVVAGTADDLKFRSAGHEITYDVVIIGDNT